ncbi:hypothetical protein [Commensalibacter nepenthis]|uniref:Bacteriophage lambda Replication protein O N-terminal domain-containing protein n=1 Tax=Commensalibacter nepenthis TaxID=3043872 RepID=A0ABT6Q826_9PROT|nr:hypothetical protein [Commensalibacter sp. TBRC 10068]MDI2113052.1 hypothetical protein [Commensalibacter sp. TBRC 10068]
MARIPSNQYYIQLDYRAVLCDGTLNSIDDAAQNIWTTMFYKSLSYEEMGHFKVNGKPLSISDLAKVLGKDLKKLKRVLPILVEVGLCEQLEDGTIIIPSSKFDQFACNLHSKCAQSDGKTTAKPRQNAEQNGSLKPKTTPPIKEKNINRKDISNKLDIPPKDINTPQAKSKHGSRLPDDWLPDEEDREYARNRGLDVIRTIEDFCGYWHAKAGKDAIKMDWSLTWKTWCRKARDWGNVHHFPKQNQQHPAKKPHNLDWMIEEDNQLWGNV